jgi:hypothetical protein
MMIERQLSAISASKTAIWLFDAGSDVPPAAAEVSTGSIASDRADQRRANQPTTQP